MRVARTRNRASLSRSDCPLACCSVRSRMILAKPEPSLAAHQPGPQTGSRPCDVPALVLGAAVGSRPFALFLRRAGGAVFGREQDVAVPADDLGGVVPGHARRADVPARDDARLVDGEDRKIDGALRDQAQQFVLTRFRRNRSAGRAFVHVAVGLCCGGTALKAGPGRRFHEPVHAHEPRGETSTPPPARRTPPGPRRAINRPADRCPARSQAAREARPNGRRRRSIRFSSGRGRPP